MSGVVLRKEVQNEEQRNKVQFGVQVVGVLGGAEGPERQGKGGRGSSDLGL